MSRVGLRALEVSVPLALIGVWWLVSAGSTSPYFPPLSEIVEEFRRVYLWRTMASDVLPSLKHFAVGFAGGVLIGFVVGLGLGLSSRLRRNVSPLTEFFRAMPIVAMLPVALLVVGPGMVLESGLIAMGSSWAVMLNTADGVQGVDRLLVDTARSYGLSRRQQIRTIVIPAAMPQVLAGVRVAVGLGLATMVVANMFAAANGLGAQVTEAQANFDIHGSWAGLIMIAIVGCGITAAYTVVHDRLLRWHRGWRSAGGT